MIGILHFITLVITTMFAAATAVVVNWLLLRGAFHLMRPPAVGRSSARTVGGTAVRVELVPRKVELVRAFARRH